MLWKSQKCHQGFSGFLVYYSLVPPKRNQTKAEKGTYIAVKVNPCVGHISQFNHVPTVTDKHRWRPEYETPYQRDKPRSILFYTKFLIFYTIFFQKFKIWFKNMNLLYFRFLLCCMNTRCINYWVICYAILYHTYLLTRFSFNVIILFSKGWFNLPFVRFQWKCFNMIYYRAWNN